MTCPPGVVQHEAAAEEIARLFAVYRRHVHDAGLPGMSVDGEYCQLFDGGLALGKVVVHAHGWRVAGSDHSRERLLQLCAAVLGRASHSIMALLEGGRRKRNRAVYDEVGTISRLEVDSLRRALGDLEVLARAWLVREHPDLLPPELPLG